MKKLVFLFNHNMSQCFFIFQQTTFLLTALSPTRCAILKQQRDFITIFNVALNDIRYGD